MPMQCVSSIIYKIYKCCLYICISIKIIISFLFQNHPHRHMKRKFHDFLTLLTLTGKLSTRAGFELAIPGTPVHRSTS